MDEYGDLNYSAAEINTLLGGSLQKTAQTLTEEEKQQVRANLGLITYEEYIEPTNQNE